MLDHVVHEIANTSMLSMMCIIIYLYCYSWYNIIWCRKVCFAFTASKYPWTSFKICTVSEAHILYFLFQSKIKTIETILVFICSLFFLSFSFIYYLAYKNSLYCVFFFLKKKKKRKKKVLNGKGAGLFFFADISLLGKNHQSF